MYIEMNPSLFDVIASSSLISIFNDDLFASFDHDRWAGKVEQGTITPLLAAAVLLLLSLSLLTVCYVHQRLVEWANMSEFIWSSAAHPQTNSICSAPDGWGMTNSKKDEQIKSMLSIDDRIRERTSFSRASVPIRLSETCGEITWAFLQFHSFALRWCLSLCSRQFLFLLHHIKKNLSLFLHPIVNCTCTYQVDSIFIKDQLPDCFISSCASPCTLEDKYR